MRKPLSSVHPLFYYSIVFARQMVRWVQWQLHKHTYARTFALEPLAFRMKKHQSVLLRKLGHSPMELQKNKVINLSLAIQRLDGLLVKPGETFSFCFLLGKPTRKKGYQEGILLSNGEACQGVGGGLCQLANLIHWLVLHSPITVTERHHHSFDPFPDDGRVIPFGSGATIFYNYIDYQFRNDTPYTFQLKFWLDHKCLNGDLRVNEELPYTYHVFEKNHRFLKVADKFFRQNEIWRNKTLKKGNGTVMETTCIAKNFAQVKYVPENWEEGEENTCTITTPL